MDAERFKNEYKHVVLFLKEMGLLKEWKEYCEERGRQYKKDWWYTLNAGPFYTIDQVFSMATFSEWLRFKKGIRLSGNMFITEWFRSFMNIHAPSVRVYDASCCTIDKMKELYEKKNLKELVIR